jgi:hypothetical protein
VRLAAAAAALREAIGAPLAPAERKDHERDLEVLRGALSGEEFARSWAAGAALDWSQAVAEALGGGPT